MNYDNLTDEELLREADGQSGIVRALSERLELRLQPQSVFHDQAAFMRACGQTTTVHNPEQAALYRKLMDEEDDEFRVATNDVDEFDAILDKLVVTVGYGLSRGWPMVEGWNEVMRSNFAKVDPKTGKVVRRDDGKILKPAGWTKPDLERVLSEHDPLFSTENF
jgi:predicted HAD superfamily Cof-like phosphohydrolase